MLRLLALLLIPLSQSCLWDTDTLRDEANVRPDLWELVSGQVPVHGEAYYRQRVARILALAKATREQRNDLAVAHIRLGDLPAADLVLAALRREDPGEYQALSNQAVLRRNQGEFAAAIPLFEQALTLKPEGHLGLGDWTLRAVRYRQRTLENAALAISEDFLGRPRALTTRDQVRSIPWDELPEEQRALIQRLSLLLRNDKRFADGFFVLGDELRQMGDNHLAVYAYARARALKHPAAAMLDERIDAAAGRVQRFAITDTSEMRDNAGVFALAEVQRELATAARWNERFAAEEAIAVAAGNEPSIEDTLARLSAKGNAPHLPIVREDRLKRMQEVWAGARDLSEKKQWPAAEREYAKAKILVEADAKGSNDHGCLLIGYAASLAPQGGIAKLRAAAAELLAAEAVFRGEETLDGENLDLTLRNLESVYAAMKDEPARKNAAQRRAELQAP